MPRSKGINPDTSAIAAGLRKHAAERLLTARGNALLKRSAEANDATFVNTFGPSKGRNACEAVGVRWIEPLIGSLTGVPVHPNATGEEHDAFDVEKAMRRAGIR
jgi:hypothetical protein